MTPGGPSESLWVSTAVKSIRLGWLNGMAHTQLAVPHRIHQQLLLAGVFEDVWPSRDQFPEVLEEVRRWDLEALFSRDTHHGRGLSQTYADLAPEIEREVEYNPSFASSMAKEAKSFGLPYLGKRAFSEFCVWFACDPLETGTTRPIDHTPWTGIPDAMADMHTLEGKRRGTPITILCGHPAGHLMLERAVQQRGWQQVRMENHAEPKLATNLSEQTVLFQ